MELMGSSAEKTVYDFFNSAQQNGGIGLHLSVHDAKTGDISNMFFDYDTAERMLESLNRIVPILRQEYRERIERLRGPSGNV